MTAQIKASGKKGRDRPKEGTQARRVLDALMTGETVKVASIVGKNRKSYILGYLRDCYGMEIESRSGWGGGCRLLGEWDGPYFVPLERMTRD